MKTLDMHKAGFSLAAAIRASKDGPVVLILLVLALL